MYFIMSGDDFCLDIDHLGWLAARGMGWAFPAATLPQTRAPRNGLLQRRSWWPWIDSAPRGSRWCSTPPGAPRAGGLKPVWSHVFVGSAIKNYHLGMVLLQAMYEKNEIVEDFWRCVELCCCFIDEFWLIVVMVLYFWNHVDGRVAIPHLWLDIKLDEHWKSPDST